MFNRNLFLLVRSIYATEPQRMVQIKPSNLWSRYYTKKSKDSSSDTGSCEPCKDDPEPEHDYGCETPTSHYPAFPMDEDEMDKHPKAKSAAPNVGCPPSSCPAPVCAAEKPKPPCTPICAEGPKKPEVCPPISSKVNLLRMISLLVILPAIIALSAIVYMTHEEIDRPPFVPYPFMRKQNLGGRKWPWNSDKSFFYNPRVNALHDGYEEPDEEERAMEPQPEPVEMSEPQPEPVEESD